MTAAIEQCDIAVVGVGAAGMMAAIFAGRTAAARRAAGDEHQRPRIVALDGAKKLGAKILVAGGGRCNVTHDVVYPRDYFGASSRQVQRVLRTFSVERTRAFFAELGVRLKREETGKLFPTSDRAQTVLDALLKAMTDAGVDVRTDHRVNSIARTTSSIAASPRLAERGPSGRGYGDSAFVIETNHGELHARQVILATGGLALPKTGSDGAGYGFAGALGHTVTPTTPALVPLVLPGGHWLTQLSGIAVDVTLSLASASGKALHHQAGALLFTHFGLSGPAAMDMSRHWIAAHADDAGSRLTANLAGDDAVFADVEAFWEAEARRRPRATILSVLRGQLPDRLAAGLLKHEARIAPDTVLAQLPRDARRRLVHALTALPLPVVRDRGYLFAEVTAGGVPLDEVDLRTMASRRCEGLHLCGEILNVDGRIGGYNFQWAWCTGRLAGEAAGAEATDEHG
ncbi:MAG: NAD(P)/FAD-dependent oxidoreductase [Phycisphaeraceae bacterium]